MDAKGSGGGGQLSPYLASTPANPKHVLHCRHGYNRHSVSAHYSPQPPRANILADAASPLLPCRSFTPQMAAPLAAAQKERILGAGAGAAAAATPAAATAATMPAAGAPPALGAELEAAEVAPGGEGLEAAPAKEVGAGRSSSLGGGTGVEFVRVGCAELRLGAARPDGTPEACL